MPLNDRCSDDGVRLCLTCWSRASARTSRASRDTRFHCSPEPSTPKFRRSRCDEGISLRTRQGAEHLGEVDVDVVGIGLVGFTGFATGAARSPTDRPTYAAASRYGMGWQVKRLERAEDLFELWHLARIDTVYIEGEISNTDE